jgi:hypothetical protein
MNQTPPNKVKRYNATWRNTIGLVAIAVYMVGVAMDPPGFVESIRRIPTAFATMATWLAFTFLVGWWLIDIIAKRLIGKSLRELIADKDTRFEQNLVIALVIAIPLTMLVSK